LAAGYHAKIIFLKLKNEGDILMDNLLRIVFLSFTMFVLSPVSVWAADNSEMDEFEAWEQSLATAKKAPAPSQDMNTDFGSRTPTTEQLINSLAPPARKGKHRAIRPTGRVKKSKPKAVSMEVVFPSNSYQLTEKTKKLLDVLGRSLNAEQLKEFKFIIEGHTDASGKDEYNLVLSEKRARSVRQYLVSKHSVSSARLQIVGKGEQEMLDVENPNSSRNRRVKIINMGR
jgi:OmpA-OmpF porin, OOP family